MTDRLRLEFEGEVVDCSNSKFNIKINDDHYALCTLSGKIRQNGIKILLGDKVLVEVSEYDTSMGRIVRRMNTNY